MSSLAVIFSVLGVSVFVGSQIKSAIKYRNSCSRKYDVVDSIAVSFFTAFLTVIVALVVWLIWFDGLWGQIAIIGAAVGLLVNYLIRKL